MNGAERLCATVRGRVQGVGFRYSVLRKARGMELNGWVANRPDGGVDVVAEGPRATLETLLAYVQIGPPGASVRSVDVVWQSALGEFQEFDVRHP
jgi:acylphosphatase